MTSEYFSWSRKCFLFAFVFIFLTGIVLAESCVDVGVVNSTSYCNESGSINNLKAKDVGCLNDYECLIKSCVDGVCKYRYEELSGQKDLTLNIWNYILGMDCDYINGPTEKCEGYVYFMCGANNFWENKGFVNGKCNYNGNGGCPSGKVRCPGGTCESVCWGGGCLPRWNCSNWSNVAEQCGTKICNDKTKCPSSKDPYGTYKRTEVLDCDAVCGDGICESDKGENYENCPADCQHVDICGDGICGPTESSASCPEDCKPIFPWWKLIVFLVWVLLIILVIVIIIILIVRRVRK